MSSPRRLSLRQSVALVWRTLRSMRTALILLLLIALASVAGSLLPAVAEHAGTGGAVPGRPRLLGFLLRAGRLLRRLRVLVVRAAHHPAVRLARRMPGAADPGAVAFGAHTARCRRARSTRSPTTAERAGARRHPTRRSTVAPACLRRRRFRVSRDRARPALAAEKGLAREIGSLAFHWAFILLLAGVVYGKGTGFSGLVAVVEGQTWVDAEANYDGSIRSGRFFDDFTGVGLRLHDFRSDFRAHRPADGLRLRRRPAGARRLRPPRGGRSG